jgi:hypothetical protein
VWWPVQSHNPGPYHLLPERGVAWGVALLHVRVDAAEAARLRSANGLADPVRRDRALLDWVQGHRNEFADGRESSWIWFSPAVHKPGADDADRVDIDAPGWGEFQLLPFTRILQARVPADCFRAVILYAELNRGTYPPAAAAAFASREGRDFLVREALDTQKLDAWRGRAVVLLGEAVADRTSPPDEAERGDLLDRLLPLVTDANPLLRGLSARAVVCAAGTDPAAVERIARALRPAYKAEAPGPARNALADSLYDAVGPQRWKSFTGRPNPTLALVRELGVRDANLFFWLTLKAEPAAKVTQAPAAVLELLDAKGNVALTRRIPLPLPASVKKAGWTGGPLYMELRHTDLKPGTWRLRVQGVTGPERRPWETELRTLRVVVPSSQGKRTERSVWGGLLRTITGTPEPIDVNPPTPDNHTKRFIELDGDPL